MDWRDLGAQLIRLGAPVIGGALLGPLGATLGTTLGGVLANALGTEPTPEAVHAALQQSDDVVKAKLASADVEAASKMDAMVAIAKAQLEADVAQGRTINETMRAETEHGVAWWHWRHLIGYVVMLQVAGFSILSAWIILKQDAALMKFTLDYVTAITPIFLAVLGLLGYVAQDTTKRITTAITGEHAPGVVQAVVQRIAPKKR